ncbi:hypothetical protein BD779DRAFT_1464742 [Infundibulicybe gibba]|nr:hypothetical protein BD779DRAFT_1464742 [Infundibulicybe gibba]
MASLRNPNHRRRSQSASNSSPVSRRSPDDAWRVATKRGYYHQLTSPSSPQKWDVDVWRRGKRRRCDPSHESVDAHRPQASAAINGVSSFPVPAFAATSAEFHFSPNKAPGDIRPRQPIQHTHIPPLPSAGAGTYSQDDLHHLRSAAFWELHRSVAENGEGLVQRMRDYEHLRSRSDVYLKAKEAQKRGRKRSSLIMPLHKTTGLIHESDGEDDDIQIFAGEPHDSRHTKRALSLDVMDQAQDSHCTEYTPFIEDDQCPSPGATSSSSYISDDEMCPITTEIQRSPFYLLPQSGEPTSFTPALSQTLSNSTNSSLVSLPLPPPLTLPPMLFGGVDAVTLASSKSEKAIAALTLALANGAGGLNDYQDIQVMETAIIDDSQVGEMWH